MMTRRMASVGDLDEFGDAQRYGSLFLVFVPEVELWPQEPTIVEYPVPTAAAEPHGITLGPDGNLWFTESLGNKIGKISTEGTSPNTLCRH
jgi:streptogramin lyase